MRQGSSKWKVQRGGHLFEQFPNRDLSEYKFYLCLGSEFDGYKESSPASETMGTDVFWGKRKLDYLFYHDDEDNTNTHKLTLKLSNTDFRFTGDDVADVIECGDNTVILKVSITEPELSETAPVTVDDIRSSPTLNTGFYNGIPLLLTNETVVQDPTFWSKNKINSSGLNGDRLEAKMMDGSFKTIEAVSNLVVVPIRDSTGVVAYQLKEKTPGGKAMAKRKAPKSTGQRQTIAGRQRTIYEGPRGGKYIKKDGKFVRI